MKKIIEKHKSFIVKSVIFIGVPIGFVFTYLIPIHELEREASSLKREIRLLNLELGRKKLEQDVERLKDEKAIAGTERDNAKLALEALKARYKDLNNKVEVVESNYKRSIEATNTSIANVNSRIKEINREIDLANNKALQAYNSTIENGVQCSDNVQEALARGIRVDGNLCGFSFSEPQKAARIDKLELIPIED